MRSISAVFALIGAVWIVHLTALRMMKYVDRVDMPCQWIYNKGFDSCDPLRAELEIKTTPEPLGHGIAVWYRATVTNQSNRIIDLDHHFYVWNDWLGISSVTAIAVLGPDGLTAPRPKPRYEEMDIRNPDATFERLIDPYHYDPTDVMPLIITEKGGDGHSLHYLRLRPGQSITASFSVLDPTRPQIRDVSGAGYVGTAMSHVPVPMDHPEKKYAVPPLGFRRLTEFDLRRPGRFTVQFVVRDHLFTDRYEDPKRPYWNRLRPWIYLFSTGGPGGDYQKPVDVEIKSAGSEFVIPR